jgi:DNA helicase II / ATP-dependent DNA helicase PcrA
VTYQPTPAQLQVIDADDPVLLVLGGAGTGKTSTAAAAVRTGLERRDRETASRPEALRSRALFLSFSRAAVAQILDRTADILGMYQDRVEITTYHAFAWSLIERFGSAAGLPEPTMATEAELKLFQPAGAIRYKEMVPLALRLCRVSSTDCPASTPVPQRDRTAAPNARNRTPDSISHRCPRTKGSA